MSLAYRHTPFGLSVPRLFRPSSSVSELVLALIIAMGLAVGALAAKQATLGRLLVGVFGGLCFFLISMNGRMTALRLSITFLVFLGLIRRLLIPLAGWSEFDPILLVGPGCAFMIWFNGKKSAPRKRDAICVLVIFFMIWVGAQIVNPLGGGVMKNALGSIYWLPPLFWFFVGRTFDAEEHRKLPNLIIGLAIPVAIHGLYQTYFGLLPFELSWVGLSSIGSSIFLDNFQIRSFGPLTSPQEYGAFLSVAICFLWAKILTQPTHRLPKLGLFLFLYFAMFMQGSRSIFLLNIILVIVTTMIWTRNKGVRILMPCAVAAAVVYTTTLPPPARDGSTAAKAAITHQLQGILNPGESSAETHIEAIQRGFNESWIFPFGRGTSGSTPVARKLGGPAQGTDFDVSNIFGHFGIPAGAVYILFLALIVMGAWRQFRFQRDAYSLAMLGFLIAIFGHVYNGGLYAVSTILWIALGGMSRNAVVDSPEEAPAGEPADQPRSGALLPATATLK